jgi:hypothetical protein
VSITDHLGLFKADWISDPERLKSLARESARDAQGMGDL